jgi:hypothetical protein
VQNEGYCPIHSSKSSSTHTLPARGIVGAVLGWIAHTPHRHIQNRWELKRFSHQETGDAVPHLIANKPAALFSGGGRTIGRMSGSPISACAPCVPKGSPDAEPVQPAEPVTPVKLVARPAEANVTLNVAGSPFGGISQTLEQVGLVRRVNKF